MRLSFLLLFFTISITAAAQQKPWRPGERDELIRLKAEFDKITWSDTTIIARYADTSSALLRHAQLHVAIKDSLIAASEKYADTASVLLDRFIKISKPFDSLRTEFFKKYPRE